VASSDAHIYVHLEDASALIRRLDDIQHTVSRIARAVTMEEPVILTTQPEPDGDEEAGDTPAE
jgi:hypothetical protein